MKKTLVLILVAFAVIAIGCGGGEKASTTAPAKTETKQEATTKKEDAKALPETVRVGTEKFGYVSVPKTFAKFVDLKSTTDFQVSDGANIVTMNIITPAAGQTLTAEQACTNIWKTIEKAPNVKVEGGLGRIGNYKAFQLLAKYTAEKKDMYIWVFEAEDKVIHFVAVEGPLQTISQMYQLIENSYALEK